MANASDMTDEERCQGTWDILWSWSKRGNLEARAGLLLTMAMADREMPGRSGDSISRMRDATVLAVHSLGVSGAEGETVTSFLKGLEQYGSATAREKFFACASEAPSQDCARIAVDEKLVPPFEHYVAEVDLFLAQGQKSTCSYKGAN